jgi:hypothetical protein
MDDEFLDNAEKLAFWLREAILNNTLALDFKWAAEDFLNSLEKIKTKR